MRVFSTGAGPFHRTGFKDTAHLEGVHPKKNSKFLDEKAPVYMSKEFRTVFSNHEGILQVEGTVSGRIVGEFDAEDHTGLEYFVAGGGDHGIIGGRSKADGMPKVSAYEVGQGTFAADGHSFVKDIGHLGSGHHPRDLRVIGF